MTAATDLGDILQQGLKQKAAEALSPAGAAARIARLSQEINRQPPDSNHWDEDELEPSRILDVGDPTMEEGSQAIKLQLLLPRRAAQDPELFYGPMMQLGTYMGVENTGLRIFLDVATDWTTYALPGLGGLAGAGVRGAAGAMRAIPIAGRLIPASAKFTLGLTKVGRTARIGKILAEAAGSGEGRAIVKEALTAVRAAGHVLGAGKQSALMEALRAGKGARAVEIMEEAMATGKMHPQMESLYKGLVTDAEALGDVVNDVHKLSAFKKLPPHLQFSESRAVQRATGQANPFFRMAIPNPIHPVKFAGQLLGVRHQGEHMWVPFSGIQTMPGLKNLAAGELTDRAIKGVFEATDQAALEGVRSVVRQYDEARNAVRIELADPGTYGGMPGYAKDAAEKTLASSGMDLKTGRTIPAHGVAERQMAKDTLALAERRSLDAVTPGQTVASEKARIAELEGLLTNTDPFTQIPESSHATAVAEIAERKGRLDLATKEIERISARLPELEANAKKAMDLLGGESIFRASEAEHIMPGRTTADEVRYLSKSIEAIIGAPQEHAAAEAGVESLSGVTINDMWDKLPQTVKKRYYIDPVTGARTSSEAIAKTHFTVDVVKDAQERLMQFDGELLRNRHSIIEEIATADLPTPIPDMSPDEYAAGIRATARHFSLSVMAEEALKTGWHQTLASRGEGLRLFIQNWSSSARDVLYGQRKHMPAANAIDEILRSVIEQKGAWEARVIDGQDRLVLLEDKVVKDSFLELRLAQNPGLAHELAERGLTRGEVDVAEQMGELLDRTGKTAATSEMIQRFIEDYMPRIVTLNKSFKSTFGPQWTDRFHQFASHALLGQGDVLEPLGRQLSAMTRQVRDKMASNKLSFREAREWAEAVAVQMEKAGFVSYERSTISSVASYMDSMGSALGGQRILRDMPKVGGKMSYETLAGKLQKIAPREVWDRWVTQSIARAQQAMLKGEPGARPFTGFDNIYVGGADGLRPRELHEDVASRLYDELNVQGHDISPIRHETADFVAGVAERNVNASHAELAQRVRVAAANDRKKITKEFAEEYVGRTAFKHGAEERRLFASTVRKQKRPGLPVQLTRAKVREVARIQPSVVLRDKTTRARLPLTENELLTGKFLQSRPGNDIKFLKKFREAELRRAEVVLGERRGSLLNELSAKAAAQKKSIATIARQHAKDLAEEPLRKTTKVWVRKDWTPHLQETLRLVSEKSPFSNPVIRALSKLNWHSKSFVLAGDVFHYNNLMVNQLIGSGPAAFMKLLVDPQGKIMPGVAAGAFGEHAARWSQTQAYQELRKTAMIWGVKGAAAGGAAGVLLTDDPYEIAGFSASGAVWGLMLQAARMNSIYGKRLMLNPRMGEIVRQMALGGFSGRPDDRAIGVIQQFARSARDQLMRDGKVPKLIDPIEGVVHLADWWDRELWSTMHNGSKMFHFATRWADLAPQMLEDLALKGASKADVLKAERDMAVQLVQTGNNAMGGQAWRFLLAQPEMRRAANLFMLSADWTASKLNMAASYFMAKDPMGSMVRGAVAGTVLEAAEAGWDPHEIRGKGAVYGAAGGALLGAWANRVNARMLTKGDVMAKEARRMMNAALMGGYATANLLNYNFTGHFMWDNEEGKKLSIQMPGKTGMGQDRFVSLGKQWLEAFEFMGISDKKLGTIPVFSRVESKLAPPVHGVINMLTNQSYFGELATADDNPLDMLGYATSASIDMFSPILTQAPARTLERAIMNPEKSNMGDISEVMIRMAGLPVNRGKRGLGADELSAAVRNAMGPPAIGNANPALSERFK